MNRYSWDDLSTGMEEQFRVTITDAMMEKFRDITGDINPLHGDREFAMAKGHENRVVYGMLTASFLSTLAGVYLPGEKSLIHSVETKFVKSVFPGDELKVSGKITDMDERFHVIHLKVEIRNQRDEKVLRGTMQIGID